MNAVLAAQFSRVESALTTLIDSITSYNPSISSAQDLLAADSELSEGLEQLSTHQQNHARIAALRAQSDALDTKIKDTITLLASTRKDLLATPATVFPAKSREVHYDELLVYAKHISKFTVPPTYRQSLSLEHHADADQQRQIKQEDGGAEPLGESNGHVASDEAEGMAISSLEQAETAWLNPTAHIPWVPWPSEETIRRGALAQLQVMIDQGLDPTVAGNELLTQGVPAQGEATEAEEMAKREEERRRQSFAGIGGPSAMPSTSAERTEKPAVFGGLDLYDPDGE